MHQQEVAVPRLVPCVALVMHEVKLRYLGRSSLVQTDSGSRHVFKVGSPPPFLMFIVYVYK